MENKTNKQITVELTRHFFIGKAYKLTDKPTLVKNDIYDEYYEKCRCIKIRPLCTVEFWKIAKSHFGEKLCSYRKWDTDKVKKYFVNLA